MSWACSRSRSGCSRASRCNSAISPACRPRCRSASMRSSSAARRCSANRGASSRCNSDEGTSASAAPRHSAKASVSSWLARLHCPARAAAAPPSHQALNRSRSSSAGSSSTTYPGWRVRMRAPTTGPTVRRRRLRWLRTVARCPAGGWPSHSASASSSNDTAWLARRSSAASTTRCLAAGTATATSSGRTDSGPSTPNRTPGLPQSVLTSTGLTQRYRAAAADPARQAGRPRCGPFPSAIPGITELIPGSYRLRCSLNG